MSATRRDMRGPEAGCRLLIRDDDTFVTESEDRKTGRCSGKSDDLFVILVLL